MIYALLFSGNSMNYVTRYTFISDGQNKKLVHNFNGKIKLNVGNNGRGG
jgi:hypothetical protein